jgi:hypothetical protein
MTVNTAAGSRTFIGTTAPINEASASSAITSFEADTYNEVGEVEDLGEFGDEATEVTFTALGNRRVRKFKGSLNAGNATMTCGDDPEDVGQQELLQAFDSQLDFNFKVTLNDALTISGEPTVQYFRGKIMSKRRNIGTVDNIVRRTFTVGINSPIYEVAAT